MIETTNPKTAETAPKAGVRRRSVKRKPIKRGFGYLFARFIAYAAIVVLGLVLLYRFVPMPATYLMVQRAFEGEKIRYRPVALRNISRNMVDAAIAAEDARFCYHSGFEWEAMKKAAKANKAGRKLRGASTISQQTAKNVFLWPGRSYVRKGLEAGYTVLIEFFWPKRRIMEAYLNVAEMGDGIFGAESAARFYYNKSAKNLTSSEAARIIAILPSPRKWSVKSPSGRVARRAARIARGAQTVRSAGLDACIYRKQ